MSDHPFYRLAPYIQEYIYQHRWDELRDIQAKAIEVILDTPHHLILSAGTASGKTEAAFLPILTDLYHRPSHSIGILYIGPTKALINDQFYRLEDLLRHGDLPVWAWHGDVSSSRKKKLLDAPSGVLQITPESLESILINRTLSLPQLFCDLRYVILDEVHIFMNSDRGRQLLCQLARLENYIERPLRRIGLSATLGDKKMAEHWLQAGTEQTVVTIQSETKQAVRLAAEHFYIEKEEEGIDQNSSIGIDQYIFERCQERTKSLIFANSRGQVEGIIASLRQIAWRQGLPDIYHVHHGSISAPLRESAEFAMKADHQPAVTAATITLELGIDIGQLERVIQLDAPFSASSFSQRLGRSGRRNTPSEMWFAFSEERPSGKERVGKQFPWPLLQAAAIVQLALFEKWIEPNRECHYPFSLLYHQTMSVLAGAGELFPAELARRVLPLPPFHHITQDDYRLLLRHLIETDHIERLPQGGLIIGLAGEKVVRNFRFYAVFQENEAFSVRSDRGEIGQITVQPTAGDSFMLAGRAWEVLDVNLTQRIIFVKRKQGRANAGWLGQGGDIHPKVVEKMKEILCSHIVIPYFQPQAQNRLDAARQLAAQIDLQNGQLVATGPDTACLFPWLGTKQFKTMVLYIESAWAANVTIVGSQIPYWIELRCVGGVEVLAPLLREIVWSSLDKGSLVDPDEPLELQKFDPFIPQPLLYKGYLADQIDFPA